MRTLVNLSVALLYSVLALFRGREKQAIVELALRQQLAVYAHDRSRPRLSPLDRTFWVALSRLWPRWKDHLVVVRPETAVRWHREGFRRYWRSISTPGPGRPPISNEVRELIVRMATENRWRARKIQAELMKLGIRVSLATVSRYLPKTKPDPTQQQRWTTFLRNHKDVIAGMDFFVVPTVRFRHGLLRGSDGSVPNVVRLVRNRSWETAGPSLQRHRKPDCASGDPATAGDLPRRTNPSISDLRQRVAADAVASASPASLARDLLGRGYSRHQELRDRPQANGLPKPMAERNR